VGVAALRGILAIKDLSEPLGVPASVLILIWLLHTRSNLQSRSTWPSHGSDRARPRDPFCEERWPAVPTGRGQEIGHMGDDKANDAGVHH